MEDLTPLGHAWERIIALEEERDELRKEVESLQSMTIAYHTKRIDALQRKLDIAIKDITAMIDYVDARDGVYTWDMKDQLKEALKKLEE